MVGLTEEQIKYVKKKQATADALVADTEYEFYEPDENERMTAARILMRKWEEEIAVKTWPNSGDFSLK